MTLKCTGSRSMNMAPVSSFKLEILPDKREVKKVSGTTVRVALDVVKRVPPTFKWMMSLLPLTSILANFSQQSKIDDVKL